MLEREASDNTQNFRLGVAYAKKGQTLEAEFFANKVDECSPRVRIRLDGIIRKFLIDSLMKVLGIYGHYGGPHQTFWSQGVSSAAECD